MNPGALATSNRRDLGDLVLAVFGQWRANDVAFLVLRNYENLPAETGNDIDVIVRPEHLKLAEQVLVKTARQQGYQLHNRVEFLPVSLFFCHLESLQQVQFDLFHDLKWRGFSFFTARVLLERAVDRGAFAVPHPAHEAVNNVLTRQIYHGYVKDAYKPGIRAKVEKYTDEVQKTFAMMFGAPLAHRVTQALLAGDWKTVEAETGAMRRQLVWRQMTRRPWSTLVSLCKDYARLADRMLRPPGPTVVLLGADGCGKSTVATRLSEALEFSFKPDKSLRVHWKPIVFLRRRRARRAPTTNPHGGIPRGLLPSALVLLFHWLEFFCGVLLQFWPTRFRNGMVLVDRYHYDFVVDPRRYRLRIPAWLVRTLFRFLPEPDRVFLLDAPAEVLLARKQEVALAELRRQQAAFRKLVGNLRGGTIVNCAQPVDEVVGEIIRNILTYLVERQSRRAGGHS
jgi:thymidylate kinase